MSEYKQGLRDRLPVQLDEEIFFRLIGDDDHFSIYHKAPEEFYCKSLPLKQFGLVFDYSHQDPVVWRRDDLIRMLEHEQLTFGSNEKRCADCQVFAELNERDGKLLLLDFGDSEADFRDPHFDGFVEALDWLKSDDRSDDEKALYFCYIDVWDRNVNFWQVAGCILASCIPLLIMILLAISSIRSCSGI